MLNILHLKYAVEVAKTGSINKAAQALLVAQPNLSRAIKELEADLGISIFERTAKGMFLTPDGEEFIGYANSILSQIDSVEKMYKNGVPTKRRFSISVPRATYISEAFAEFSKSLPEKPFEIFYKETNSEKTVKSVIYDDCKLGIVRYAEIYDKHFKSMFDDKGLICEIISEFRSVLIMKKDSPLACLREIHFSDLENYIEAAYADPYVPSLSPILVKREELTENINRRILVHERASALNLLSENSEVFMWASPVPQKTLDRYGLVGMECADSKKINKDVLIYKKDHTLTELERNFITELCLSKRKYL